MPPPTDSPIATSVVPNEADVESALVHVLSEPEAPDVASGYLFGSVAEGRAHRESDLDIAVLLAWAAHPSPAERFDVRLRLIARLQAVLAHPVDLVVLNDAPPLLARHIVTRGHRVLCRDVRADHACVRDAQLRAADLEPWLRRMRTLKLCAIRE